VGFEHTIPAFERAKAVHASGLAVAVIGPAYSSLLNIIATEDGEMKGAFSTHGCRSNAYITCVGTHEGKSPTGED
jgi:hypothetical protein